jgi:hypothetical protein
LPAATFAAFVATVAGAAFLATRFAATGFAVAFEGFSVRAGLRAGVEGFALRVMCWR